MRMDLTQSQMSPNQLPLPAKVTQLGKGHLTPHPMSRNGSDASINRIRKDTMYDASYIALDLAKPVTAGTRPPRSRLKASQQSSVARILAESGFMPRELVQGEVDWFYNHLGIDNTYLYVRSLLDSSSR